MILVQEKEEARSLLSVKLKEGKIESPLMETRERIYQDLTGD